MPINLYTLGMPVTLTETFTDADNAPVDPDTVLFKIKDPDGTTTTYDYADSPASITSASTGDYQIVIVPTLQGRYFYRWESTGDGQAASEGEFLVADSRFS